MTRLTRTVAFLLLAASGTTAMADVKFVNLSNRTVYLARYRYVPYSSSIPAGEYNLPAVQESGWAFSGWGVIRPGATYRTKAGHYYLKNSNGAVRWNGRKDSTGFVTSSKFSTFVPKHRWAAKERELLSKGYRKVKFQHFTNGTYRISGNAYRIVNKKFNFNFSSHSWNVHMKSFPVNGQVVDFSRSATKKGASNIRWYTHDRKVSMTANTEGAQARPFGPREKGFYRGTVTVYYTVRN